MIAACARNVVPGRYRGVSVATVPVELELPLLRDFFIGRDAYYKTRFVVARRGEQAAVLSVTTKDGDGLFKEITDVGLLAGAEQTVFVHAREVDTAIPSELARVAVNQAPDSYAVVVHGRYEHVNFILGADPLQIRVYEVVPPHPAKLFDQAARILAVREDLPPIELIPDVIDLADLAEANPAPDFLLPCRGSGFVSASATVHYLDEHPVKADWTLLGCTRSQQIHQEFYGEPARAVTICPLERAATTDTVLSKCCLQDDEIRIGEHSVSVPWGSSLERVSEALDALVQLKAASWQPA